MNFAISQNTAQNNFKRFWLSGLGLAILLVVGNSWLSTAISPLGILDHQSAGSAARVNAIQIAWQEAGLLSFAKVNVVVDLLFIAVYFFGAVCGGMLMRGNDRPLVKRVGVLVILAATVFFITDNVETILQTIQLFQMQGSDNLAKIVALMAVPKITAMLVTVVGLLLSLLVR